MMAALLVSQAPVRGQCQMMFGPAFAKTCAMKCCKKLPMPKCPMLKAQAPRDTIAGNTIVFESLLQPLQHSSLPVLHDVQLLVLRIAPVINAIKTLIQSPPLPARAPPAFIHLINA